MKDEFAVDESGLTSDGYHRLLPVSKKSMYLKNLIRFAILAAICFLVTHFGKGSLGNSYDLCCIAMFAAFVLISVYLVAGPAVFYRRYRYRLDEDKAEIRRGIIVISHTLVPIERIHQVQVSKGPINRMFGLANVIITTAGGVTTMEYLDEETAESIASTLNECVVKMLRDRDQDGQ